MRLLDWNLIENSRNGVVVSKKVPYGNNPPLLNSFICSSLERTIPHLKFSRVEAIMKNDGLFPLYAQKGAA